MTTSAPQNQFPTTEVLSPPTDPARSALDPAVAAAVAGAVNGDQGPAAQAPISTQEGVGTDGEFDVWQAHYSAWNFTGRLVAAGLLTTGWIAWVLSLRSVQSSGNHSLLFWAGGGVVVLVWLLLLRRIVLACVGHSYRLTNRRLFVSTGVFHRFRNQIELLRVQDVSAKQNLWERILSLGTVQVVSSDPDFPNLYLLGVRNPQATMDEVWNRARAERDKRSVKVDAL